ncbi:hypothetical protein [Halothiobacillus sp. DCM-1]|uniref:hypothetical protein n=1 Tax=Halothiobacillus sp. DCM-1 TaxID=3112558 RepID=UPI003253EA30
MTLSAFTAAFLSPTGALLMAELAAGLLLVTLGVLIFTLRARSQRLNAARTLLDDRDALAKAATETFTAHCAALIPERPLTDEEQADYRERSQRLIGHWVEPWLQPSQEAMVHAVREVMTARHNDLHQIAAILRQSQKPSAAAEEIQQLHNELSLSRKAESERSAQLAEALRSVGIIVGEYGRKFGLEGDYRVPQILRALLYLQALDQGNSEANAKALADDQLSRVVLITNDEPAPESPANEPKPPAPALEQPAPEQPVTAAKQPPQESPDEEVIADLSDTPSVDDILASIQPSPASATAAKTPTATPATSALDAGKESVLPEPDEQGMINLDEIPLPEKPTANSSVENLNFDDIDALLEAEINRQAAQKAAPKATKLPGLEDDEFDLSKKP